MFLLRAMRQCGIVHQVNPDEILTTQQAAAIIGRSPRTIQRLVNDGKLESFMRMDVGPNGALVFKRSEVDRFKAANRKTDAVAS